MPTEIKKKECTPGLLHSIQRIHRALAPHAYSLIMLGALVCTVAVKFYHALRYDVTHEFLGWILADLVVLLGVEAVLAVLCFRWPKRWMIRSAMVFAAIICTWSVINGAWVIKTGAQILPVEVLPLVKDPLNHLGIIGIGLAKMPVQAFALLGPSSVALTFFFFVLANPACPKQSGRFLFGRILITLVLLGIAIPTRGTMAARRRPSQLATSSLHFNSQLKALTSIVMPDSGPLTREDFLTARRQILRENQINLPVNDSARRLNVVMVVLESIQYSHTSFVQKDHDPTPFLRKFADEGVLFTNTRSTLTHTSKALFSLLSGRYPCASQDVVEAVPTENHYASLATVLNRQLGYRTAFFQSAKGSFEARPSLVKNLGFDTFWAREHNNDPNCFLGYLAADDFIMLDPMADWIKSDTKPFFAVTLCSAAHDPYEVPSWYGEPAKEPQDRYKQIVSYTDRFVEKLDNRLAEMGLKDNTVVCIVGDHAEAMGEHGKVGHERIGFEEVLRIVWAIRSPGLQAGSKIHTPVSSIDVAPTLFSLLGFDEKAGAFAGKNALLPIAPDRRIFFSGWIPGGPAGYIVGNKKYLYTPSVDEVSAYDLTSDPQELASLFVSDNQARLIAEVLIDWRKKTVFQPQQEQRGKRLVFNTWLCSWAGRDPTAKYQSEMN
jgi:arylsulfatase A-like enzyme